MSNELKLCIDCVHYKDEPRAGCIFGAWLKWTVKRCVRDVRTEINLVDGSEKEVGDHMLPEMERDGSYSNDCMCGNLAYYFKPKEGKQ